MQPIKLRSTAGKPGNSGNSLKDQQENFSQSFHVWWLWCEIILPSTEAQGIFFELWGTGAFGPYWFSLPWTQSQNLNVKHLVRSLNLCTSRHRAFLFGQVCPIKQEETIVCIIPCFFNERNTADKLKENSGDCQHIPLSGLWRWQN